MAWSTYLTDADGRPALALLDRRFELSPPTGQLPRLAWFGVWCRLSPGAALWDPEESLALEEIEDALIELVGMEGGGWAAYVRRLSTFGIWEYFIYTGPRVDLASVLAKLRERFPEYRIEYEHRDDSDWALYRKWLIEPSEVVE